MTIEVNQVKLIFFLHLYLFHPIYWIYTKINKTEDESMVSDLEKACDIRTLTKGFIKESSNKILSFL